MSVLYDPNSPSDAVLNTFGARWGFTTAFVGMGLVFIAGGMGMLRTAVRRR